MSDKIARPYAAAAFAHAKETGAVSLWGDMFTALVATEETLQSAISGHTAGENTIAEALIDALDITDSGQRNFLRVLAQNQRLQATAAIAARFEQLRLQDEGISVIRVETAVPMDAAAQRDFDVFLEQWSGSKVRSTYEENSDLLGGVRVYAQDNVLDASIRGRINRLAAALA